jgi:hypothetical protein
MLTTHAELVRSLAIHFRVNKDLEESGSAAGPVPIVFVPVRKTSAEQFVKVARTSCPRTWCGFVLLRWPDAFVATLQIAFLLHPKTSGRPQWTPLTLASGNLGNILFKHTKKPAPQDKLVLLNVPFLRLQALARFASEKSNASGKPTISIVQPGITRLSSPRTIPLSAAAQLIADEVTRLSHPSTSGDPKPKN